MSGPGTPKEFILEGLEIPIGREPSLGLVIDVPEVSRRHAKIFRYGLDYAVRDLESRNGVWLNNLQIASAVLRDGDRLRIGPVVYLYIEGD